MWAVLMLAAVMVGESSGLPRGWRLPIHSMMTEEEFKYYFGDKTEAEIEESYSLGMIRKVEDSGVEEARFRRLGYQVSGREDSEGEEWWFETAFNEKKQLHLKKNRLLVSERANIVWMGEDGEELERKNVKEELDKLDCHKIHKSDDMVAAVSNCRGGVDQLTGFVSTLEDTYQFDPLTPRLMNALKKTSYFRNTPGHEGIQIPGYLFKKVTFPNFTTESEDNKEQQWDETAKSENDDDGREFPIEDNEDDYYPVEELEVDAVGENNKVIEAGIFFDHLAYNRFAAVYNDSEIEDMIFAYINQVAAIYRLPSLGQEIDIMITMLEIQKGKVKEFDNMEGERAALQNSFCAYSNSKNQEDDQSNPRHYDVGILVSGLDLWKERNGVKGFGTLGIATTNGMCHANYSCVVVEFGVRGALGESYPTTGFSAAYTLAHELGHSLGMRHDTWADGNKYGHIMSVTRPDRGQMTWSDSSALSIKENSRHSCLKDRPQSVGHDRFQHELGIVPGYFYTPQEQCRFFFAGKKDVDVAPSDNFCKDLRCSQADMTPEAAGAPMEGTLCGGDGGHWCREGACVPIKPFRWSPWRSGPCTSACTQRGTGARDLVRHCERLPGYSIVEWRSNDEEACGEGVGHKVELCEDSLLCGASSYELGGRRGKRTRAQLANWMCEQEAPYHPALSRQKTQSFPGQHSDSEPWKACLLYCKRADGDGWVNPRGKNFPDGTWCHTAESGDYYCQAGQCLPPGGGEDVMAVP